MSPAPTSTGLPSGFTVRLRPCTRTGDRAGALLRSDHGVLRLKPAAVEMLGEGDALVVGDRASAALARVLLDRGLATPWWPDAPADDQPDDVTVVVPVHGRPDRLARLLRALPKKLPVVVVDDGSPDPAAIAAVVAAVGAHLRRHPTSRGPAAARNTGLAAVRTPLVAFLDSDVVPVPGWLGRLRRHFQDPLVGVVGPRVLGLASSAGGSWLSRYEAARSSLDLGPRPGGVAPHAQVPYLPSAALLARRECLVDGFDASMRVAEDVDLVWRVHAAGWRVRYDPAAVVRHEHRTTLGPWLGRKAFYGTGAGPLADRHGTAVAPIVLTPWTTALAALALAQRRWSLPVAGLLCALVATRVRVRLPDGGGGLRTATALTAQGAAGAMRQTASALTRHYLPVAAVVAIRSRRARRALAVAMVADALLDHRRVRPALDPARHLAARRLDDAAYAAGLWYGAWRCRSVRALLPAVRGVRPRPR
jgi:mycofactocin glycosyltransferase